MENVQLQNTQDIYTAKSCRIPVEEVRQLRKTLRVERLLEKYELGRSMHSLTNELLRRSEYEHLTTAALVRYLKRHHFKLYRRCYEGYRLSKKMLKLEKEHRTIKA